MREIKYLTNIKHNVRKISREINKHLLSSNYSYGRFQIDIDNISAFYYGNCGLLEDAIVKLYIHDNELNIKLGITTNYSILSRNNYDELYNFVDSFIAIHW